MTGEEINQMLDSMKESMDKSIEHLEKELSKVRTGRASTSLVNDLLVEYYGSPTPLNQVANVATSDARTITIQPWEKNMLGPIEKAIFQANLGLTPMNDGEMVRISVPPLTEERRKELVKMSKGLCEETKVGLRQARHKAMDGLKKAIKDGYPEDSGKRREDEIKNMLDNYTKKVEVLFEAKEKDVMTV